MNNSNKTTASSQQRRPKGGNVSAIDSRCSQTKDHHANGLGFAKSQVASNTAFGMNNTSHTTICSNRKQTGTEIVVSGKKHSLQ